MTNVVAATDLSVVRSGEPILKGISLSVEPADRLLIQGPSGAGKTTLFHVLGLLEPYTSGTLRIGGTNVATLSERDRARIRRETVGVVFQDAQLVPDLTAWENALLPQQHDGDRNTEWIERLFSRLGIASIREQYPATLSGGEQQRVAIARALANRPNVLLADEPTGQLDATTSDRVVELLFEVQDISNAALLCISHDRALESIFPDNRHLRNGQLTGDVDQE